ncbi:MAG: RNA recognition motif domain-containing protein [Deferribacterales bacterium]|jgi:RNA recognition motif-containing protein
MNIYVGNLSFSTKEDDILALFSNIGDVDTARIITDRDTGRSKGFGFVEMPNNDQAKEAIEKLNGTELDGRNLTVNEAKPKSEGNSRGGFGGGRGGNGGFGGRGGKRY